MTKCIVVICLFAMLTGCRKRESSNIKNVFRYNESQGIISLDPAFARNQTLIWPSMQLYNGLVQMDEDLNVIPAVAKSWETTSDGKIYTFYLRDDVFFHDHPVFKEGKGRKVNAGDFEFSFSRILDPELSSPGFWIFNKLDKSRPGGGFQAINDTVFRIWLSEPFPPFLGILTMPYCSVIPVEISGESPVDLSSEPIGTGPFRFQLWRRNEKLVLVKNENYFEKDSAGNSLPYLDGVAISFIKDKQSEFMEFLLGNIDFLSGLHAVYKDELTTRTGELNPEYAGQIRMDTEPYLNTEYLGFLMDTANSELLSSPLHIPEVRKAINFGFDRSKMLKYLRNNMGYPAVHGFLPAGLPYHEQEKIRGYSYNPDSVWYYLEKAGFSSGKNIPEITLTTTSDYLDICEFIQYELSRFGINLNLEVATGGAYRNKMANGHLLFFRGSWIADYPDPENYLSLFYSRNESPAGPNYTRFNDPFYDSLYVRSLNTTDPGKREKLHNQMDNYLVQEAVIVPLFYDKVIRFFPETIENFEANPLNALILKKVKKK